MNLILCGLPLSGKSYYGKKLAERLRFSYIETDFLLEAHYQKTHPDVLTCRQIMTLEGEAYFRELEKKIVQSLDKIHSSVISIGGGTLISPDNVTHLKKLGKLIYIETDIAILLQRLKQKTHPPAYLDPDNPSTSYQTLARSRIPLFERYSDVKVFTKNLSDEQVLERILTAVEAR